MADLTGMLQAAAGVSTGNPNAWDISKAYYDPGANAGDLSKAVYGGIQGGVGSQETVPTGIYVSPDGLKLYIIGETGDDVNEYNVSPAWTFASGTLTYVQNFFINNNPQGVHFKPDGTVMYVSRAASTIEQFNLSTAWDISSATTNGTLSVSTYTSTNKNIFLSTDGTKLYVVGSGEDIVIEYDLSTAWDVTSGSYVQSYSVTTDAPIPQGLFFDSTGTKMYVTDNSNDRVAQYALSTAWDVSSASHVQNFSVSSQSTNPTSLFFYPNMGLMFVLSRSPSADIFTYVIGGFSVAAQESVATGLFFKPDGTKMYVIGQNTDDVHEYDLSTAWDISTVSYVQGFDISSQETNPSDLFFKEDGTKMYVIGTIGDDVNEYSLSVAWDVSTLSYVRNFSVASQETVPNGVFFKTDGTKMYIVGLVNDTVYQYSLATAWNLSTASYDSVSFSVSTQETDPHALSFKPDGTKMYILGQSGDDINEYDLSTPWDISSASYVQNFPVFASTPTGLAWRDNGEEFFIVGSTIDRVSKYIISPD